MILGVSALIRKELPEEQHALAETSANFTKAVFQFTIGSWLASTVYAGGAGLPRGWAGVSLLIVGFGVATIITTARLLTLRNRRNRGATTAITRWVSTHR